MNVFDISAQGQSMILRANCCGRNFIIAGLVWLAASGPAASAQQPGASQGQAQPNVTIGSQNGLAPGSQGGAAQADFDSLIDLIQSTVAAESWADNGTGDGQLAPFDINGIFVDPGGALRFTQQSGKLAALRKPPGAASKQVESNARQASPLRYVSLPRLEAAIARRQQRQEPLSIEMLTLAGLQRVEYVMVFRETGDFVIAGPAGDWLVQPDGRIVGAQTGQAVVRLDDLLTLWRRQVSPESPAFGCSIIPRQLALAQTQEYLSASSVEPVQPAERENWLQGLRDSLGKQDVEFFGIEPDSHVSQTLLVADYHMKLIGMGIVDSVDGVSSYLDTVRLLPDGNPPPMSVLRWWFAMKYEPVETSPERDVFVLRGQGAQVLSENELLAEQGRRVPAGRSEELNRQFAESFSSAFELICQKYPLYGELRNIFDLAMVLEIFEREGLPERVGWQPSLLLDGRRLRLPSAAVPREVDTVINHRVINSRHIIAGVSGGVWIDAQGSLRITPSSDRDNLAKAKRNPTDANDGTSQFWWWE